MKYAKPQKYVFGERPAKPPYGKQVFTKIVSRKNVFNPDTGERSIKADAWDIYAHTSPSRIILIGRVRRHMVDGYTAQYVTPEGITPWCEVKNAPTAAREAARRAGIA